MSDHDDQNLAARDARRRVEAMPGLKEADLAPCAICGGSVVGRSVISYRVVLETIMVDPTAVAARLGLGVAIGNQALAAVIGPDRDLAKILDTIGPKFMCLECAARMPVASLLEERDE